MVVVGAGTGGTVAGIGRKIKEKMPEVKVGVYHINLHAFNVLVCRW